MRRSRNSTPARAVRFFIAAGLMTFVGCGVRAETRPTALNPDDVPFRLLQEELAPSPREPGETSFAIFFLDSDGRLAPVERPRTQRAGPNRALQQLFVGPTDAEAQLGLATAIPPGTEAQAAVVAGDLVVIELAGSLVEASAADAIAAIAQLVFTATEREDLERVLFRVGGEVVEIPRGDGTLTSDPVGRDDYAPIGPTPIG